MNKLTAGELARITLTAQESFNDTCTIRVAVTSSQDSYGQLIDPTADIPDIACGFSSSNEYRDERGQVVMLECDAILRLSLTQDIAVRDVVLVHSKTFSVDGIIEGRSVKIVALKEKA